MTITSIKTICSLIKANLISKLNNDQTLKKSYTKTEISKLKFHSCYVTEREDFNLSSFIGKSTDAENTKISDLLIYPGIVDITLMLNKEDREDKVDKKSDCESNRGNG